MVVPYPENDEKACVKKARFNKKLRRGRVTVIECGLGCDFFYKIDSLAQIWIIHIIKNDYWNHIRKNPCGTDLFPTVFWKLFFKFLVKIVPCAKRSSNSYRCLSLTQIWVNWISQFYKKMCSRIWKGKYPVLHYGITSKSPVNAGRLILCLGALHNLVLYYTTEEETRLAVKWLPLIGYAVLGLAW